MSVLAYGSYMDSGVEWLGQVPSHWSVRRLKLELCEVDVRAENRPLKLLGLSKSAGIVPRSDITQGAAESDNYGKYKEVRPGDLVMNKMQAWNGVFGLSALAGMVSPDYSVFEVMHPSYASFICEALRTEMAAGEMFTRCRGMGVAFLRLNSSDFLNVRLAFPPPEEARAIAAFLDRETGRIDALVETQRRLIELLKEKRQAVISHAVIKGLDPVAPMKDSGVGWLGEVPAHWDMTRVKYAASNVVDCLHTTPTYDGELKFPAVRTADIERGRLILEGVRLVSREVYENRIQRLTPKTDDILYTREGERFGLAALVPPHVELCLGQRMMMIRVSREYDAAYVMWVLNSDPVYQQVVSGITGATAPHVNISEVINFHLPVPPISEQQAIAEHILDAVTALDNLAMEAEAARSLLQERRSALISAAVTGKIDVRGAASQSNVVSIDSVRRASNRPSLSAVVGTYAIREVGSMGRMAVMKAGYLAEGYAGFSDLGGRYDRNAAGPYDSSLISAMERGAREICGIVTHEPRDEGRPVTYEVPKDYQPPAKALSALVGEDRATSFLAMLSLLKGIGRDGVEAVATIYAVWNDLLAAGKPTDDDAVCNGVLNDWHPEKSKKFKRTDLDHWLAWMRRNGLAPDGSAPRTDHQGTLFA